MALQLQNVAVLPAEEEKGGGQVLGDWGDLHLVAFYWWRSRLLS
ncbi:MAG: hypothetical protein AAF215_08145 [Cyanobacteria bacterium P01_A01_bin.123]